MIDIINTNHAYIIKSEEGKIYHLEKIQRGLSGAFLINPKNDDLDFLCTCAMPKHMQEAGRSEKGEYYEKLRQTMEKFVAKFKD